MEVKVSLVEERKEARAGLRVGAFVIYLTMRNRHFLFSHTSVDIPILQSGTYWSTFDFHTYQV